ncbi:hypothetical protein PybrP1_003258 [[Pythium] brassicae (nom. inval.)]|nr:hypothetical protein PybrP1_003258 [[Pythium] brassicae (nom. inval.)]
MSDALVQALGEFALFAARHARQKKRRAVSSSASSSSAAAAATEKQAVLAWLRALPPSACASLSATTDAAFVRTLLSLGAAAARQRRRASGDAAPLAGSHVPEFHLLPPANKSTSATRFHATLFGACCDALRRVLRVLNVDKSCDTLALATALFEDSAAQLLPDAPVALPVGRNAAFLFLMEHVSDGQFLAACPSDAALRSKVWGETPWLASQGYYALEALVVNQIELNVWRHWGERKKAAAAPLYRVPLAGLAAKSCLADEWNSASARQQRAILSRLEAAVTAHLRSLGARQASFPALRAALATLTDVVTALRADNSGRQATASVDVCFSCSFTETLSVPQAAVLKLILAEKLQDECSLLLSERLAREDEGAKNGQHQQQRAVGSAATTDGSTGADDAKSNSQRRRANRKKLLKKRRHDAEERVAQHKLLKKALEELKVRVRRKREQTLRDVAELLDEIVERAAAEARPKTQPTSSRTVLDLLGASKKKAKKRKKSKKREGSAVAGSNGAAGLAAGPFGLDAAATAQPTSTVALLFASPASSKGSENKENSNSKQQQQQEKALTKTPESRPLLSFLDKSYASPLSLPTFGPQPLYASSSSTASPPFFLSLAPRELPESDRSRRDELLAGDDRTSSDSAESNGDEQPKASAETKFGWYLPSLFSSEASMHTSSAASSLDWDFNNWQLKNDAASARSSRLLNAGAGRLRTEPPAEASVAASKAYSLESFSDMLGASPSQRDPASSDAVAAGETSSTGGCSPESAGTAATSDFLYQQGGFFDRQRTLKRRRRPLPFDYEEDDRGGDSSSDGDDTWGKRAPRSCCDCSCHNDRDSQPCECSQLRAALDPEQRSAKRRASDCSSPPALDASELLARLAKLEAALEEKTQALEGIASTLPKEVAGLQQTVSSLSAQLSAVEAELQELNADIGSSPPPPLSSHQSQPSAGMVDSDPAHQQEQRQQQEHAIASGEYMYSSPMDASASVFGPFVSVPMSVLPPRTKLHWDMCEFISQLQADSNARLPAQMAALRLCTAAVQSLWPRAQVRPYGSFVSRLVLPSSDIDLVICLPKVRRDAPADAAGMLEGRNAIKETWQQNLARKLRQEPWVVPDSVRTIPLAAIPIITLVTAAPYNVRLDISFEGPGHNGLATNDVVLSLIHEFPPLAPIMLVLKSFAIERGFAMAYSGGLSSYSLLLMVARYLQEHNDTLTSGFENVSAAVQHSISSQSCADFGMMLMGFLDFYGNRFDPRTTGISVASRCFLNRENLLPSVPSKDLAQYAADDAVLDDRSAALQHHHHYHNSGHWQMPQQSAVQDSNLLSSPGSRRYGNRSSMDWPQNTHMVDLAHDPHKFDPVFIEDPLHASNNVGRNLFRITQIRRAFSAAYSTLLAASVNPSVFSDNRTTKITGMALHPENMLRAILGGNAPVKLKSDASGNGGGGGAVIASSSSSAAAAGLSDRSHAVPPGNSSHLGYPTAVGSGGVGFPYPTYTHAGGVAGMPHYFNGAGGGGGGGGGGGASGGADASHSAQPYPFYSHYQHQHQHYLQVQQQRAHAVTAGGSSHGGARSDGSSATYRRQSEFVSERAASGTRPELGSAEKYYERRRDRLVSPRLAPHSVKRRTAGGAEVAVTSTATAVATEGGGKDDEQIKTRKGPARSLSFADVVVGGAYSASTMEYHRKEASSPLTRPSRYWRDDSTIEGSISERW